MKRLGWKVYLGAGLVALSALLYLAHYFLFHDAHHIFIYLIGDIAFVPLDVLIVTLIIHRVLAIREKRSILHKLNMVIGIFFEEMGTDLTASLMQFDADTDAVRADLIVSQQWTEQRFAEVLRRLRAHKPKMDTRRADLAALAAFLKEKRDFLLRLMQNPSLLEHEAFTDMLWAVFHLGDELAHRHDLRALPESDCNHLAGDMDRAYTRLVHRWVSYMYHLKKSYPYLFSIALRTNPFDPDARPEVV